MNPPNLTKERSAAVHLLAELKPKSPEQMLFLVKNSTRFQTWGFCTSALECSWAHRMDDAGITLELAQVGAAVAERLRPEVYGADVVQELRATGWAYVGNAHRILSDFVSAEKALLRAESHVAPESAPVTKALVLDLKACVRIDQGHHSQALKLFDLALGLYRSLEDFHGAGTIYAQKGMVYGMLGDFDAAKSYIEHALIMIDPEEDVGRFFAAQQNLVWLYEQSGDLDRALSCLREHQHTYLGETLRLNRLRWVEARLYRKLGDLDQAETVYLEVARVFLAQAIHLDAAQATLELTLIYAEQGRMAEVRDLALEVMPVFQVRQLPRFLAAALRVFSSAAQTESVTVELAERLLAFLDQAKDDPKLEFEP